MEESVVAHVSADGTRATLTGKSLVEASPFGMGRSTWRLQQDIDLVRRDGRWLMVEARQQLLSDIAARAFCDD